jgi:4-hydroxy-2-oxoheptanedioate aldolase
MKSNAAKQRMIEGKPAIGAEVGLGSPLSAEMLSPLGFDCIVVDNQHGNWREETTMYAFRSIALGSAVPMARVRYNDFGLIGRLLDIGALGVMVPMVNTVEEAEAAARAVRLPPRGGRSGGPFGAGFHGDDYMSRVDDEVFLAVQIETDQAVGSAEEIMAVEGVDGCWVGPNDLALSMGTEIGTPEHTEAIESVIEACRKTGKFPGISLGDTEVASRWIERGMLFVTVGDDGSWMLEGAQAALRAFGR